MEDWTVLFETRYRADTHNEYDFIIKKLSSKKNLESLNRLRETISCRSAEVQLKCPVPHDPGIGWEDIFFPLLFL